MRNNAHDERGHSLTTTRGKNDLLRPNIKVNEDRYWCNRWLRDNKHRIVPDWWKQLLDAYEYNYTEIRKYLDTLCPYCMFNDSTRVGDIRVCKNCNSAIP
jgi:hypothetical protein